jgi:hypothetical protein
MSKAKDADFEVVIIEGAIRVTHRERTMTIRCCVNDFDEEDDDTDVIVYLDDIRGWDAPHDKDRRSASIVAGNRSDFCARRVRRSVRLGSYAVGCREQR